MPRHAYVELDDVGEPFRAPPTPEVIELINQPFLPRSLARRSLFALASVIPVILVLWGFQRIDDLGTWNRRLFNTLSISSIALMSLFLGSVTQLLGTMIRWPLLASRAWSPRDVDRILGISDPTISIQLICHDIWPRRQYSKATATAFVYLLATIGGSLGVAILGLTYDLNDVDGINYPVMLTDWGTTAWLNGRDLPRTWRKWVVGTGVTSGVLIFPPPPPHCADKHEHIDQGDLAITQPLDWRQSLRPLTCPIRHLTFAITSADKG